MKDEASATLYVAFNPPHRISAYKSVGSSQTLLGFSVELLRGRSIKVFAGPKTDTRKLSSAIKMTALNTPVTAELDLYNNDGACQRVTLTFTPCVIGAEPIACKICIIQRSANHPTERLVTDMKPTKPEVALAAFSRDPVPSPYVRKICIQERPEIPADHHPSMRLITWRRIDGTQ